MHNFLWRNYRLSIRLTLRNNSEEAHSELAERVISK